MICSDDCDGTYLDGIILSRKCLIVIGAFLIGTSAMGYLINVFSFLFLKAILGKVIVDLFA